ncbi:MAG: L,D-transpeptidase family protein [Bacteroidia bacterium]
MQPFFISRQLSGKTGHLSNVKFISSELPKFDWHSMKTRYIIWLLSAAIFLFSCGNPEEKNLQEKIVVADDSERVNKLVEVYIREKLNKADTSHALQLGSDSIISVQWVNEFYSSRQYTNIWTDHGKLTKAGDSIYALISRAEDYGLIPDDYHLYFIDSIQYLFFDSAKSEYNINALGQTELLLTDAFFTMAVHAATGRVANDSSMVREWHPWKLDTNIVALLNEGIKKNQFSAIIDSLEPKRREYKAIKLYMNSFRKDHAHSEWNELPVGQDTAVFLEAVKQRLILTGDYDTTWTQSDSVKLAKAIKSYQKKHYLEQDGRIGKFTYQSLKLTIEGLIRQMAINLERWRLEPPLYEKRHMLVNLPAFNMRVYEEDTLVMESRIVCGAFKTQTPLLDSKINQMILYPYWNVPYSIAWKEILPHVKRDTGYLRRNRYEVLDRNNNLVDPKTVKWKKYGKGNLPYKFRQMTGDENALGVLKFNFNNKYGVYMHDTNSKSYFKRETRSYSHGCMRLEKYQDLAYFLLREDTIKIPYDTFDVWMGSGVQRTIYVRKPLPIHVRYFTCDVDSGDAVRMYTDIYGKDEKLIQVIYAPSDALKKRNKNPRQPASSKSPKKLSIHIKKKDDLTIVKDSEIIFC